MADHRITPADELDDGDRILVELEGREIAVFNLDGEYYAYLNWCAHQGGPVCEGNFCGTYEASYDRDALETTLDWSRQEEILMCPWHGWEYDALSGDCLSRDGVQLPSYPIRVEDGEIVVSL